MSPVISLEPKHVSRHPKEAKTAALVDHAAAVARRLVEDIDYESLGPSGALAKLGLAADAPSGLHLQGAAPGCGAHSPALHLTDATATMCWRLWFTLPGVEPGEVASFLKSGTLRSDPSLHGLLHAPGRVDHAHKVAELKFSGRRAMVLHTLHHLTSSDSSLDGASASSDGSNRGNESSGSTSSSVRASQLRIIFGSTTSDGRLMVVEYPVTHSHCREHDAQSLLLSTEAALEAAAAPPPPPPAPAPQPEPETQEAHQETHETHQQEQEQQEQQPQTQPPLEQQHQQPPPIMPRLFLNVYVLIPRQDGGTRVTLHQAACGPRGSVLHVPDTPHPDFAKQLDHAVSFVEESVAALDGAGWERALEMIQRQQKRGALRAVGAADVDDDMRAFLAQMAMDGAEEEHDGEVSVEVPAALEEEEQEKRRKEEQQRRQKGRLEGSKRSEQEAVDGWDEAWAGGPGAGAFRRRTLGSRAPSSDGSSIDFVELSDDEGGQEAPAWASGRDRLSLTRRGTDGDESSGSWWSGRSPRNSMERHRGPRSSFERQRGHSGSSSPQTRKVKMHEVTSLKESSSSLSKSINGRSSGTLGFSEVPRTSSKVSQQQQQPRQQRQRQQHAPSSDGPLGAVAGVFGEMANNLSKLWERGEALDRVEQKTARMENQASNFADMATKLKEDMANRPWWRRF